VSYSCRDLLEDREQFPAPLLLELYRSVKEEPEADYRAFRVGIGRPAGFIPTDSMVLDETGWWLERLREPDSRGDASAAVVRALYPWLGYGWQAEQERSSDRFTVFDGQVRDTKGELDPRISREPVSCTQIEAIARCPFSYFLRYVLGIEPPNDYARDPTLWLDALEFGSLIHEIFRAFMVEITARREKPNFAHHWAHLKRIAEEHINRWHTRVPAPNIAAFTTQRSQVLRACRTFLKDEEIHCQRVTPRYFEVPFGLSSVESDAPIGSSKPVSIDLGTGEDLLLRGRIDRVDQRGRDEYEVWDYKSGSAHSLREDKQLNRGRQIQHALYARALEILLARAHQEGRVVKSGYFFPGPKGEGQRIAKEQDASALNRVVRTLFHLLREGVFPYALDSDSCRFCDYQCVCEESRKANERIRMKFDNEGTSKTGLEAFKRLMDSDD
jgi:ATP-dependent helicase/nuclease subunit B